jgi:hypothetical protein
MHFKCMKSLNVKVISIHFPLSPAIQITTRLLKAILAIEESLEHKYTLVYLSLGFIVHRSNF